MLYRPLPPDVIHQLLKGHTNELAEMQEKRSSALGRFPCPRCGGAMQAHLHAKPFAPNQQDPLPRRYLQCIECGHEIDEATGVVIKLGNPADVDDPFAISGTSSPQRAGR